MNMYLFACLFLFVNVEALNKVLDLQDDQTSGVMQVMSDASVAKEGEGGTVTGSRSETDAELDDSEVAGVLGTTMWLEACKICVSVAVSLTQGRRQAGQTSLGLVLGCTTPTFARLSKYY